MSKKAIIVIEKGVDGGYSVFPSDDIKSLIIGDGATVAEAKADFLNSVSQKMMVKEYDLQDYSSADRRNNDTH